MGCQTRTDENINHTRYFNTWTYLKQCQHLNSDIHKFQACSSVFFKSLHDALGLFLALLPLLKCMSIRRYKRTCRPHPSLQASAWWTKRARKTGDISLHSNDDTIVPNDLNRHDRKQLPRLSLRERLGNVVQLAYSLAGQWHSSLRSNVDAMVLVSLNRYDREQFNKTEPLASLDSVAQLASAMATFSLCSNVDSILAREARARCGRGRPSRPWAWGAMCHATLNASPWQTMSFAHGPIVPTNQMRYDTKRHFLKNILYIYSLHEGVTFS